MQLSDPRLKSVLSKFSQHNWSNFDRIAIHNYVPRVGPNLIPVKNSIVDQFDLQIPTYDPTFNNTFADITDKRCHTLLQSCTDRPWLIQWSGGIDSTLVLTSILKNTSKADRENMYISCNNISVYENPKFYYDHILPNFKIINSSTNQLTLKQLQDYYLILGEFNDQLHSGSISTNMAFVNPKELHTDFLAKPDNLIDYLRKYFSSKDVGEWFYQQQIENIQYSTIPMATYYDFFWWHFFNNLWITVKLRAAIANKDFGPEFMKLYTSRWIGWFETEDYQKWAMVADNRIPPVHVGKCKPESKKYIYDYDHNEYYYEFKTKMMSISSLTEQITPPWFCVLDDYTTLHLDNNLDQILELLPAYIR